MSPAFRWATSSPERGISCAATAATARPANAICANRQRAWASTATARSRNISVIPQTNVIRCEPGIPEELCSSFDPLGNAVHTALTYDLVGEDVLITGAGPIGHHGRGPSAVHVGAKHVVITDVNDYRLNLAREICGAVTVNVARERLENTMRELVSRRASMWGWRCPATERPSTA